MTQPLTRLHYQEAADYIRQQTQHKPTIGLILGSGLGGLAEAVKNSNVIPSTAIPHWPRSTVEGHAGRLVMGHLKGQAVLCQQGRVHYYEGLTMQQITFPVRVMHALGITTLIVTNAAGGVNQAYRPGDLMLIKDHINLVGMAGANPLIGPNDPTLGPRFPDMGEAYDLALRDLAARVAMNSGMVLPQGVYCCLAGPTFETPAEVRMLNMLGADAVGMSTAPEVVVARHCGMRVLGFSGISNVHKLVGPGATTHEEVLEAGKVIGPKLTALIQGVLASFGS